jgi:uncharacterized protein
MWREMLRNVLLMSVFGAFLSGAALPAQAGEIRDDAAFFSPAALAKAEARLEGLHKEFGKEVRIETFKTVPGGRGDEVAKMDAADRARFFERWTRDRATTEHVKGIYVLITRHPGHVEIAVDRQTQNQGFGAHERRELRDKIMANFHHEKYDEALLSSVDFLNQSFQAKLHAKSGTHAPVGAAHGRSDVVHQPAESRGIGLLGWILIIGAVLLGIRLLGALFGGMMGGGASGYGGGYGPGYGGGGSFLGSLMTGMLGAVAGNWLYHSMFGGSEAFGHSGGYGGGGDDSYRNSDDGAGEDFQTSGGDFDSGDKAERDFDGGDTGGGDFGGGDFGGGDFGGGDFGGGDFGGGGDF